MLALLPIVALAVWIKALSERVCDWRVATVAAAVAWGTSLIAITEILSVFHAISAVGLSIAWMLVLLNAVSWVVRHRGRCGPAVAVPRTRVTALFTMFLVVLGIELAVLAAIAVISPPNTWDAMSYHMARLIHWQESGSVAFYPAYVLRQLYMPPGAEYVVLHLQILSGGDHLAPLVQWASMVATLIGVSVVARDLGARGAGQLCAAVFAASVPIGVLEATSTQNDQVLTLWLVCAAVFGLKLTRTRTWPLAIGFGASLGLAMVTKATAYVWTVPLLLWVCVPILRTERQRAIALLAASGVIAVALNVGMYARNTQLFGQPLGQTDEGLPSLRYLNDTFEPALFLGTLARDVGINFVATPSPDLNALAESAVVRLHTWLGVDIADPRTTWSGERFRAQSVNLAYNESFASNPVHLTLIVLAATLAVAVGRIRSPRVKAYAATVIGGLMLFAALVRWQPWHTRLELPFFALGAPLVAVVLERLSARLAYLTAAVLLVYMVPYVVANDTRALTGDRSILSHSRTEQYFTNWPEVRPQYMTAINMMAQRGCNRVGFVSTADGWEYPLWALLPGVQEIQQINVPNMSAATATMAERAFEPCAVLVLGPGSTGVQSIQLGSQAYGLMWADGKDLQAVALYAPT